MLAFETLKVVGVTTAPTRALMHVYVKKFPTTKGTFGGRD
jgi:hypothetical protein